MNAKQSTCVRYFLFHVQVDVSYLHSSPCYSFPTRWHGFLFVKEESGINAYCYDAMNDMTDFYSINTLWNPEQSAMEYTVNVVFSTGLDK